MLDILDVDLYWTTYKFLLQEGAFIEKGSKGEEVKGLQQTLVALGRNIEVNGIAGEDTITALNEVREILGYKPSDRIRLMGYERLIKALFMANNPMKAEALLVPVMGESEFYYARACALEAQGRFPKAKEFFEKSQYGDYLERAARCEQKANSDSEAEPTAESVPESTPAPESDPQTVEILDILGVDSYKATYEYLLTGGTIGKGAPREPAKGLQETLVALGRDISVDGSVGSKTITAMNEVQEILGLGTTDEMDAAGYEALIRALFMANKPKKAEELLLPSMDRGEFYYTRACALEAQGRFYRAKQVFEQSGYADWEARAAGCAQDWPKSGVLYSNSAVWSGSNYGSIDIKVGNSNGMAVVVKIYTEEDVLARTLFIGTEGSARASNLPVGNYYILREGFGVDWYGVNDTFGEEGSYYYMPLDDEYHKMTTKKNGGLVITLDVHGPYPEENENSLSWNDF